MNADGLFASIMNVPVVGVAIGLMFTYLIASLVASAIKEVIADIFQWRGTYLQKGIAVLLSSDPNAKFSWGGPIRWFFAHFTRLDPVGNSGAHGAISRVIDWLRAHCTDIGAMAETTMERKVLSHPVLKGTPSKMPSYVSARDFASALLDTLRDGSTDDLLTAVTDKVGALSNGDIKKILSAFITEAPGDLNKLQTRIEAWFDDAMDRFSGIYKRYSQCFLFLLGLLIAGFLNVDSVHLAIALWDQPALRAQIVAQEQAAVPASDQTTVSDKSAASVADTHAAQTTGKPTANAVNANPASPPGFQQAVQQLKSLPLPIGRAPCASWAGEPTITPPEKPAVAATATTPAEPVVCAKDRKYQSGWDGWNWLTLLGWLVTGVAISFGAPFWFDLLQNIANLRSSGAPPRRGTGSPQTP